MRRPPALALLLWLAAQSTSAAQQPLLDWICGTGLPVGDRSSAVAAQQALWVLQSPGVLTPDYTGPVSLTVAYAADVPALRVFYYSGQGYVFDEFPRTETRTINGTAVDIFKPSWPRAEFLVKFGLAIDFDAGQSSTVAIAPASTPIVAPGVPAQYASFTFRAMSRAIGSVPVVKVDETAQYSSHVINLVVPGLAETLGPAEGFSAATATKRAYRYLGDDYDQIGIVFRETPFRGNIAAQHESVRNAITGIGSSVFNATASYGSSGRLEGVNVYYGQLGHLISNHEMSHQWGHFFDWQAIAGIASPSGHTPLWGHNESPIPQRIAPWERMVRMSGVQAWQLQTAPEPTHIPPLQAYAMGRLSAAAVGITEIFESQAMSIPTGTTITAATRAVTIDQIIAHHGPRQGPVVESLRVATILVSRDQLATQREMDYWTFYTQRLEDPNQTGLISQTGIGSFESISGVTLHTALVTPPGVSLAGHTLLEPATIDPGDLAGLTLDAGPRRVLPASGIFRMAGRIDDPMLKPATSIHASFGDGIVTLISPVAADGTFAISGPINRAAGRPTLRVWLTLGALTRPIAAVWNVNLVDTPMAPAPPVGLSATVSGRSVVVRWSPDSGAAPASYRVDVGSTAGSSNLGSFPIAGTTLAASNVADGRYFVRVRAQNAVGISAPSAEQSIVVGCLAPDAPGTLTGGAAGNTVTLNWLPSPTAGATYTVIAGSSSGASNIAQVGVGAATSLTAVAPAGRYFIRVRALAGCGAFAESNEIDLPVGLPPLPGAPAALTSTVAGHTVSLTWQAASGTVSSYSIEAGSAPGLSNLAVLPIGATTMFSVSGVPGGTYYVRVRAINATGPGPSSNEVIVVVP